jgi:hypothetical protein
MTYTPQRFARAWRPYVGEPRIALAEQLAGHGRWDETAAEAFNV